PRRSSDLVPTAVTGGLTFAAVSAGTQHTCGVTTSDVVYCWGLNGNGQLGDGTVTNRLFPTPVAPPGSEPTPDYTLSLSPAALMIVQGATGNTTVTITRTNFSGAVTLSLGNAPAGVTGSFSPAAPTGTSSTLTVNVGGGVAPGVYHLTINGTGSAGNRSTQLTLTVGTAGSGNVTVDFSSCPVAERAVWLAAQNGTGPWIRVSGVGDVYTCAIGSGGGGLAYVVL